MEGPRPEGTETLMATPSFTPKADLGSLRIHDGERKSRGMGRRITIVAIPVVIFAGIVAAAFAFRSQKPMVEVVSAARPDAGGPQTLLNASGYITPRRRATIAAKITGRVTGVFFDEGTRVAQEQLLATLDDLDVKRALDAAKADREAAQAAIADYEVQLRNANIQLKRAQDLQSAGVQTQEALDNARTAVDSLKAKIALARQQVTASESRIGVAQQAVDNCTIRAPFAGIVVSKDAQVGEMVSPNSAGGGFTCTGIATIVDMKYNFILPDMGVKVAFLENEKPPAKDKGKDKGPQAVAFIPKGAVRSDSTASFVFLVRDGKVERRVVSLGMDRGTDVAIMAGVSPGDSLVVKGPESLRDGEKVEIRQ